MTKGSESIFLLFSDMEKEGGSYIWKVYSRSPEEGLLKSTKELGNRHKDWFMTGAVVYLI